MASREDGLLEPAVAQHRRVQPMGEVAQLCQAPVELVERVGHSGAGVVGHVAVGGQPQLQL